MPGVRRGLMIQKIHAVIQVALQGALAIAAGILAVAA